MHREPSHWRREIYTVPGDTEQCVMNSLFQVLSKEDKSNNVQPEMLKSLFLSRFPSSVTYGSLLDIVEALGIPMYSYDGIAETILKKIDLPK